jgi:hypothetical protein
MEALPLLIFYCFLTCQYDEGKNTKGWGYNQIFSKNYIFRTTFLCINIRKSRIFSVLIQQKNEK